MNTIYHIDPPELLQIAKKYLSPGEDLARLSAALRDAYFLGFEHGLDLPFEDPFADTEYENEIGESYAEYLRLLNGGRKQ